MMKRLYSKLHPIPAQILLIIFITFFSWTAQSKEPNWDLYNTILKKYVSEIQYQGHPMRWVSYSQMRHDPEFFKLVKMIQTYPIHQLEGKAELLSFYINAYNILTMKMIIDRWPIHSIKDAGGFFVAVWHKKAGLIDNKAVTLHHLENNILRKMGEPRIHFAVNCASIGCPDIRNEAYTAVRLENQLNEQTIRFLNNHYKGVQVIDSAVHISKIFKWFRSDFDNLGGPSGFIKQYISLPPNAQVLADITYNWSLNGD